MPTLYDKNVANIADSGITLLGTATIDMKTAAATTIMTVPAGKTCRITAAIVWGATASLAGGTSYTINGFLAAFSLATLVTPTTGFLRLSASNTTEGVSVASGVDVQLTVTTGSTAVANATVDIFGYYTT